MFIVKKYATTDCLKHYFKEGTEVLSTEDCDKAMQKFLEVEGTCTDGEGIVLFYVKNGKHKKVYAVTVMGKPYSVGKFANGEMYSGDTPQGTIYANEMGFYDPSIPLFASEADFSDPPLEHKFPSEDNYLPYFVAAAKQTITEHFPKMTTNENTFYAYMLLFASFTFELEAGWLSLETQMEEDVSALDITYHFN